MVRAFRPVGISCALLWTVAALALTLTAMPAAAQKSNTAADKKAAEPKATDPKSTSKADTKADSKTDSKTPSKPGAPAKPAKPESSDPLERAVDFLTEQSEVIAPKYEGTQQLTFARPNGPVAQLKPEDAPRVVDRMKKSFTSEPLRDSYIRWHLMHVVLQARPEDRKKIADDLMSVAKTLKPYVDFTGHWRKEYKDEPEEIGSEYRRLFHSLDVVEGVPPFQRTVHPPESLKLMSGARKAQAEATWAKAEKLKDKFKTIRNEEAIRWNEWMRFYNWMQRQYRGEIMYAMYISGDPGLFDSAITAIGGLAKTDVEQACDAAAFLNAAYFNGFLKQYDMKVLRSAADKLKQYAAASPKWDHGRNLPEVVFHFVRAIEAERVPNLMPANPLEGYPAPPPAVQRNVTPDKLDLAMIDQAIARAARALVTTPYPDVYINAYSLRYLRLPWHHRGNEGHQSLSTWAMLAAGESNQSPLVQKRINWSLSHDSPETYDRAMRLQMLRMLPRETWKEWVRRDRDALIASLTEVGNFPTSFTGEKITDKTAMWGDNANGQYGVMGLAVCEAMGHEIPLEVWKRIDTYWRQAQKAGGKDEAAGWALLSSKAPVGDRASDTATKATGPMTASGVLALTQAERYLYGPKRVDVGNPMTPELANGLKWLDTNYNIDETDFEGDWFYYMWTIQNVGQATGYRTFKDVDWFRQGTAKLLNTQDASGKWKGPKGEMVSTAFALLYLYRARGPLAICKIEFESEKVRGKVPEVNWNNRPNDLVNFTDWVTESFETPTSWQIVNLEQPIHELIESPTLYLATDKAFTLPEEQIVRLREYIDSGGMLICVPEGSNFRTAAMSMRELAKQLFPAEEPQKVTHGHPFYELAMSVKTFVPMLTVSNSIRPLMVIVEKDIARDLQADTDKERESFQLLANMYLYATGRDAKRPRLASNYVPAPAGASATAGTRFSVARVSYQGNFNPEPLALPQLKNLLAAKHGINMTIETKAPGELTAEHKMAFLTLTPGATISDADIELLKKWTQSGGTLWVDAAAGNNEASGRLESLLPKLAADGKRAEELMVDRILSGKDLKSGYDVQKIVFREHERGMNEPIRALWIDNRPAVLVCMRDLTSGLAGLNHWGITGPDVATARQLVVNSVLDKLGPPRPPRPAVATPTTAPTTKPAS